MNFDIIYNYQRVTNNFIIIIIDNKIKILNYIIIINRFKYLLSFNINFIIYIIYSKFINKNNNIIL